MNWKKTVFYVLIALIIIAFQPFWNKIGGVFGMCPDGCLAFLCALTPFAGWWSLCFAAVMGFLTDLQVGPAYGFHLLIYLMSTLLMQLVVRREGSVIVHTVLFSFLCVALRWTGALLLAFIHEYSIDFYAGFVRQYLPAAVLTALLTALLTLVISKIDGAERLQTPEDELQILH
ncbi:MAG: hypothetical protein IKF50_06430 [Clostridia bacterium]|nr:hypothetical protein [Clostridia bacterium]